ncbi:MAG: MucBP domain-containing protein, partial [Gammaproteobacteria bacterium]|nr:MucBP domain-containing protein [Gammaproteobacteria bacterium]
MVLGLTTSTVYGQEIVQESKYGYTTNAIEQDADIKFVYEDNTSTTIPLPEGTIIKVTVRNTNLLRDAEVRFKEDGIPNSSKTVAKNSTETFYITTTMPDVKKLTVSANILSRINVTKVAPPRDFTIGGDRCDASRTLSVIDPTPGVTYRWSNGQTGNSIVANQPGTFDYWVRAELDGTYGEKTTKSVELTPRLPKPHIQGCNKQHAENGFCTYTTYDCAGCDVEFGDALKTGDPEAKGTTVQWSQNANGGGTQYAENKCVKNVETNENGVTYYVRLKKNGSCDSEIRAVKFIVKAKPTVSVRRAVNLTETSNSNNTIEYKFCKQNAQSWFHIEASYEGDFNGTDYKFTQVQSNWTTVIQDNMPTGGMNKNNMKIVDPNPDDSGNLYYILKRKNANTDWDCATTVKIKIKVNDVTKPTPETTQYICNWGSAYVRNILFDGKNETTDQYALKRKNGTWHENISPKHTIKATNTSDYEGNPYYIKVRRNINGCQSEWSEPVKVYILDNNNPKLAPAVLVDLGCGQDKTDFKVLNSLDYVKYQWEKKDASGTTILTNAQVEALDASNVSPYNHIKVPVEEGVSYRVRIVVPNSVGQRGNGGDWTSADADCEFPWSTYYNVKFVSVKDCAGGVPLTDQMKDGAYETNGLGNGGGDVIKPNTVTDATPNGEIEQKVDGRLATPDPTGKRGKYVDKIYWLEWGQAEDIRDNLNGVVPIEEGKNNQIIFKGPNTGIEYTATIENINAHIPECNRCEYGDPLYAFSTWSYPTNNFANSYTFGSKYIKGSKFSQENGRENGRWIGLGSRAGWKATETENETGEILDKNRIKYKKQTFRIKLSANRQGQDIKEFAFVLAGSESLSSSPGIYYKIKDDYIPDATTPLGKRPISYLDLTPEEKAISGTPVYYKGELTNIVNPETGKLYTANDPGTAPMVAYYRVDMGFRAKSVPVIQPMNNQQLKELLLSLGKSQQEVDTWEKNNQLRTKAYFWYEFQNVIKLALEREKNAGRLTDAQIANLTLAQKESYGTTLRLEFEAADTNKNAEIMKKFKALEKAGNVPVLPAEYPHLELGQIFEYYKITVPKTKSTSSENDPSLHPVEVFSRTGEYDLKIERRDEGTTLKAIATDDGKGDVMFGANFIEYIDVEVFTTGVQHVAIGIIDLNDMGDMPNHYEKTKDGVQLDEINYAKHYLLPYLPEKDPEDKTYIIKSKGDAEQFSSLNTPILGIGKYLDSELVKRENVNANGDDEYLDGRTEAKIKEEATQLHDDAVAKYNEAIANGTPADQLKKPLTAEQFAEKLKTLFANDEDGIPSNINANGEAEKIWYGFCDGSIRVHNYSKTKMAYLKVWAANANDQNFLKDGNNFYQVAEIDVEPKFDGYKFIHYDDLAIPESARQKNGSMYFRFRLSYDNDMTPTSFEKTGEIEDHKIIFREPDLTNTETTDCKNPLSEVTVNNLLKTGWTIIVTGTEQQPDGSIKKLVDSHGYSEKPVQVPEYDREGNPKTDEQGNTITNERIQRRLVKNADNTALIFQHHEYDFDKSEDVAKDFTDSKDRGNTNGNEDVNKIGAGNFKFKLRPGSYRIEVSNNGCSRYYFHKIIYGDSDCDGKKDNVDVDDDNDGILDVNEGYGTDSGNGTANDKDGDGIPDEFDSYDDPNDEAQKAIVCRSKVVNGVTIYYDCPEPADVGDLEGNGYKNSDNDPTPDYLDLDSDNDGCVDAIEGGNNDASDPIKESDLVNANGIANVGMDKTVADDGTVTYTKTTKTTAGNENLCGGADCVYSNGLPNVRTALVETKGQAVGTSADATKNSCSTVFDIDRKEGTPAQVDENGTTPLTFEITQNAQASEDDLPQVVNPKESKLLVKISSTGVTDPVVADDIKKIVYTNPDGTKTTIEGEQAVQDFFTNGVEVTIPANSDYAPVFEVYPNNDTTPEKTETVKMTIEKSPNDENDSSAIDKPEDTGTIIDDDKTKVNIHRTSVESVEEGATTPLVFEIVQAKDENTFDPLANPAETTVTAKIDTSVANAINKEDVKSIKYIDANGVEKTLTDAEVTALFDGTGLPVTIPANSTGKPRFEIITNEDTTPEQTETVKMTISNSTNPKSEIGKDNDTGNVTDDDPCNESGQDGTLTVCVQTQITETEALTALAKEVNGAKVNPNGGAWDNNVSFPLTIDADKTITYTIPANGICPERVLNLVVTANPASVGGTVSSDDTVCTGTNRTVLTLSGHTGDIVKWQSSTDEGATWTDIANTTTTYTATDLTATTKYRAVVKSGKCDEVNSTPATITVNPASVGGAVNTDATVCKGTNSTVLTLSGHTGDVVKWQSSTDEGATWTDIANTTTTYTATDLTATTKYRAVVKSGECAEANSTPATVTVNVTPAVNSVAVHNADRICSGADAVFSIYATQGSTVTYTVTGNATPQTVVMPTATPADKLVEKLITIPTVTQETTLTVTKVEKDGCVTEYPNPKVGSQKATMPLIPNNTVTGTPDATTCVDTAITDITLTTTGATGIGTPTGLPAGVTVSWENNTITISGTPTESANSPYNYSIPLTGGCGDVNATGTITVTAKTVPTFDEIPAICRGGNITLPTTSKNGVSGTWSPEVNKIATETYTFTPANGECATTATLTVIVNDCIKPVVVHYVDEDGNPIKTDNTLTTDTSKFGDDYDSTTATNRPQKIATNGEEYILKEETPKEGSAKPTGTVGQTKKDITYVYKKVEPAIDIVKSANKDKLVVGQTVTYTFTVTNTGNVTLTNVAVTDAKIKGAITLVKTTLEPNEETTGTGTYVVTQDDVDAGKLDNTATVTGNPPAKADGTPATPVTDDSTVKIDGAKNPALTLVKTADKSELVEGQTVTY